MNCTALCQSGWKIHSSNVDTTQKHLQVWLSSQPDIPREANCRSAFRSFRGRCDIYNDLLFTICCSVVSLPLPDLSPPLRLQILLSLASSLTDDSGWRTKYSLGMADSEQPSVCVTTKCFGVDRTLDGKRENHVVYTQSKHFWNVCKLNAAKN